MLKAPRVRPTHRQNQAKLYKGVSLASLCSRFTMPPDTTWTTIMVNSNINCSLSELMLSVNALAMQPQNSRSRSQNKPPIFRPSSSFLNDVSKLVTMARTRASSPSSFSVALLLTLAPMSLLVLGCRGAGVGEGSAGATFPLGRPNRRSPNELSGCPNVSTKGLMQMPCRVLATVFRLASASPLKYCSRGEVCGTSKGSCKLLPATSPSSCRALRSLAWDHVCGASLAGNTASEGAAAAAMVEGAVAAACRGGSSSTPPKPRMDRDEFAPARPDFWWRREWIVRRPTSLFSGGTNTGESNTPTSTELSSGTTSGHGR